MQLPVSRSPGPSLAVQALGLGGDALSQQVEGETEEQRKRRIREMQERGLTGATDSLATTMLFGGAGGLGR